jgi:Rieske Fe-S protein
MDRRTFLKTSAAGGAVLAVGLGAPGCGNDVIAAPLADAMVDDSLSSPGYGTIQVTVPRFPELAVVGGAITLKLQPLDPDDQNRAYALPPDGTVLLVQYGAGQFAALQSSCPHAGCPLGYSARDKLVECPCHASRFLVASDPSDKTRCAGAVTHTPSKAPLTAWKVTYDPTQQLVTVDLKSPLACNNEFPPVVMSTLTLPFADFPQLAMTGGAASGQPAGTPDPIVVIRVDPSRAVALDARCTHRGCLVNWTPSRQELDCPCHGSAFALDGSVLSPPATTPLKSFAASITVDSIVVTVL